MLIGSIAQSFADYVIGKIFIDRRHLFTSQVENWKLFEQDKEQIFYSRSDMQVK